MTTKNKNFFVVASLLCILFFGALLRFSNLDYGFEDEYSRPDERAHSDYAISLVAKALDIRSFPIHTPPQNWGPGWIGFNSILFFLINKDILLKSDAEAKIALFAKCLHEPRDFIFSIRVASVIFSSASLVFVFLIGNLLFGARCGLLSSLICAVSPLLLTEAKAAKEDSLVLFTLLAGFYLFQLYVKNGNALLLRSSCLCSGFAFGVKIFGLLMLPIYAVTFCIEAIRKRRESGLGYAGKLFFRRMETCALYFTCGYLFLNFYFLLSPVTVFRTFFKMNSTFEPLTPGQSNLSFFLFDVLPYGLSGIVSIFALFGIAYFIVKRVWSVWSLIGLGFLIFAAINNATTVYDRYSLPLIPITAILAFGFITEVTKNRNVAIQSGFPLFILALALFQLLPTSLASNRILGQPSTRKFVGDFLKAHAETNDSILIARHRFSLWQGPVCGINPVSRDWFEDPAWIRQVGKVIGFDKFRFLSVENIADHQPEWIVVEYDKHGLVSLRSEQIPVVEALIESGYEEVFEATPARELNKVKFNSWNFPVDGLDHAQNYGPRIKVFQRNHNP